MNTFSEHGNDFVGRLLHEGGIWRRTFFGFSQYQKCLYGTPGEELMTLQPLSMIKSYNNSLPLHLKRIEKAER